MGRRLGKTLMGDPVLVGKKSDLEALTGA